MVNFLDLKKQYLSIKPEVDVALQRVLDSTQFVLGAEVLAFEEKFAAYCQTPYAVAMNSGTSALHLALLAGGIQPGDEVITCTMTFVATVAAIEYAGAKPVLVDADPFTYTLDVNKVEEAITPRTKAIIPVHLYGQMVDMNPLMEIARRHKLLVIEDASQAHGAEYQGRRAGSIGDFGCFSFYPGKNLGAYGEGGAVTTHLGEYARTLRMLRDWGAEQKYKHVLKGYNYRMDGFQGAVLGVKMNYIEGWTETRIAHAAMYRELLQGVEGIQLPTALGDMRHVYHIYAIRYAQRDALQQHLKAVGIYTGIHYPQPIHLLESHQDLGYSTTDFPVAVQLGNEELSLPMYPELTTEEIITVAQAIKHYVQG
jgi:dTDP-4-amino-4,6-dideoxygalactose transaminase